jgi:hypothetical protein
MTIVTLSPVSDEFGLVERQLQVQLKAPQLKLTECLDLTSPTVDAAYQQYVERMLPPNVVTVFLNAAQVAQPYTDISAKGLKIDPHKGLRFTTGTFAVDRSAESVEVLVLSIALGAPLNWQVPVLDKTADAPFLESQPTYADVKPGYHSLVISGTNQFVVFNPAQVKVGYLARFAGGANIAESTALDNLCDLCGAEEATVFCLNCAAKLCAACDEASHAGNPILQRHERIPIAEARARMEFCPLHPKTRVEYYCPICKVPVCIDCKMTGTHSKGVEATHALVPIQDAYTQALEATEPEDPIISRRRAAIADKRAASERLLDEILANEESVEAEIRKFAEEAIEQAKKLAGEKAVIVRSVQTELDRKAQELDALEESLRDHRKKSGPQAFLRAVDRQATILKGLQNTEDLPLDLTVRGDLTVYGNLTVGGLRDAELSSCSRGLSALVVSNADALDASTLQETPTTPLRKRGESGLAITSLALVAQKKERRSKGTELPFKPFQRSLIVTDEEKRGILYRVFPFKGQPQPHLLFATGRDGRSIEKLHALVDGIGITAVIVKVGERVFGGFAASKWNSNAEPFGEEGCSFLFSVTKDAVIPYKGGEGAYQLFATPELISFGKADLILGGNFDECSSEIEGAYGVGFPVGSEEAKTYLAGAETFAAEDVEIWGFYTVD